MKQTQCICTHSYAEHDTMRAVDNSLGAMAILGAELTDELLDPMPLEPPSPDPPIGKCEQCACENYAVAN